MKREKFINSMSMLVVAGFVSTILFALGQFQVTSILQDVAYVAFGVGTGASIINLLSR